MNIDDRIMQIAAALPERNQNGRRTTRDVCLTLDHDGSWTVMAGGFSAVHIGEWGGDFVGEGETADEALTNCLKAIKRE